MGQSIQRLMVRVPSESDIDNAIFVLSIQLEDAYKKAKALCMVVPSPSNKTRLDQEAQSLDSEIQDCNLLLQEYGHAKRMFEAAKRVDAGIPVRVLHGLTTKKTILATQSMVETNRTRTQLSEQLHQYEDVRQEMLDEKEDDTHDSESAFARIKRLYSDQPETKKEEETSRRTEEEPSSRDKPQQHQQQKQQLSVSIPISPTAPILDKDSALLLET